MIEELSLSLVLRVFCDCIFLLIVYSPFLLSQGIYRVNAAKSRVEKLCQAFENGKDLVELSELSPHDISNVLKLYLRQVGLKLLLTDQKVIEN